MMKSSKIISLLYHPLMMPLYFLILFFTTMEFPRLQTAGMFYFLVFIFFSMTLLPGFSLVVASKMGLVKNIWMPSKRDSRVILLLLTVFYAFIFKIWFDKMPDLFYLYIFGNFVFLLLILFIFNFFYRLDWYTIFWGSLLGFYIVLLNMGAKFSVTAVAVIILSAGLVAVIRQNMECGRQNSRLYISFFVGLFITLGIGKYVLTF